MRKESKANSGHEYLGALAESLGKCHPYEISGGILTGETNWVRKSVEASLGSRKHPTLYI